MTESASFNSWQINVTTLFTPLRIPLSFEFYEKLTESSISILKGWHAIFASKQLTLG